MIRRLLRTIKNSRRTQIVLALLLVFIFFQAYHMYRSYNDQQTVKQDTLQYLQEERAYNIEKDIAEIKVYLASMKEKTYMSAVVFSDEHDVIYFYAYAPESNKIKQVDIDYIGEAGEKSIFKHEENE